MLSVQQAETLILDLVQPLNGETDWEYLDLLAAGGRILAAEIRGSLDFPYWDNSAMDGYAVRIADVQECSPQQPVELKIIEEIPAGYQPQHSVQPGQAARIFTGAVMPSGADTIVIQERTQRQGNTVQVLVAPKFQDYVRHQAAFYQAGMPLLEPGTVLNAPELAILATVQCTQVTVCRRPVVAIFSTGNELVAPGQTLNSGQIVDSNQYALAHLVSQAGAEPLLLGIVPDRPELLKAAIAQAVANADLVLSSGGVSVGDYDYVDQMLADLGAEIQIRAVAVKPGKPLTVATFPPTEHGHPPLYFGLPGNPVSALVSFWRFVQPALKKLSGLSQAWGPQFVTARSRQDLQADGQRETYLWGQLHLTAGTYEFDLAKGSHSSGNLINLGQTNSLAVLTVEQPLVRSGSPVQVLQVSPVFDQLPL